MQAKLYQITPYNLIDNNFYNFSDHQKFRNFINQIETPIEKDVSIVKLESYNKIMYKIKFDNTKKNEEKLYCGIKYMIVDDKYWFITNFEVKKNNNQGFITYYAQLDHWATQWLTVKKYLQEQNKTKALYVERMHQTRFFYENKKLYINFKNFSPYHLEEKIQINNYIPNSEFALKSDSLLNLSNTTKDINRINRCFYFLRVQLNKPIYKYWNKKVDKDFISSNIFIILNQDNIKHYLDQFNPNYMSVFSIIDYKFIKYEHFEDPSQNTYQRDLISAMSNLNPKMGDKFILDVDFYKTEIFSGLFEEIVIDEIDFLVLDYFNKEKSINREMIFNVYPYSKYLFLKGNNFKEYKINELFYNYSKSNENDKLQMRYLSFISNNVYNLWIYPSSGIYSYTWSNFLKNNRTSQYITYGLNITNNLEIPTTSNSYKTYAQSNLNSLQTNINQAEMTRKIANQETTISLITSAITTALGAALAPVTFGTSLGLAAAGAVNLGIQTNKWINTQIKNDFPVDSLNSKLNDMKNTPNIISSNNNDYSWLTYFNNDGLYKVDENGNLIYNYSFSKILVSTLSNYEKNILFDWYYFNGYLCNRYLNNLNFDENRNRYIFNFYKIKDIKTLLSSCPEICNEDIEWWNNTFNQGIIIWETDDHLKLYDKVIYIGNNKYENWEIELLNESTGFFLQQLKKT